MKLYYLKCINRDVSTICLNKKKKIFEMGNDQFNEKDVF